MTTLAFVVLAVLAVVGGWLVFVVDSMARATFCLAVSFVAVGGVLLLLDLDYLGIVVVVMMVMEMAIMAVFMIMYMMNPAGLMPMSMRHNTRGSLVIAGGTFVVLVAGILLIDWPAREQSPPDDVTFELGMALMGRHMLTMIVIGVTLLATMVAGVMLATKQTRYDRYGDDLDRDPADDPVPGGVRR